MCHSPVFNSIKVYASLSSRHQPLFRLSPDQGGQNNDGLNKDGCAGLRLSFYEEATVVVWLRLRGTIPYIRVVFQLLRFGVQLRGVQSQILRI